MFKRVLALFFVVCLTNTFFMIPALASESTGSVPVEVEIDVNAVDFADWCVDKLYMGTNWLFSFIKSDVCPHSPNYGGRHEFEEMHTQVNHKTGNFYICKYCGRSAGEVLEQIADDSNKSLNDVVEQAYNNYVSTLPAQSIDSDGALYWSPQMDAVYLSDSTSGSNIYAGWGNIDTSNIISHEAFQAEFDSSLSRIFIYPASGNTNIQGSGYRHVLGSFRGTVPVSGFYQLSESQSVLLSYPIDFSSHIGKLHYIRADTGGDVPLRLGTTNYSLVDTNVVNVNAFKLLYNSRAVSIIIGDDIEIPIDLHTAGTYSSADLPGVSIVIDNPASEIGDSVLLKFSFSPSFSEYSVLYNDGQSIFYDSGAAFSDTLDIALLPRANSILTYIYCTIILPKYRVQPLSDYISLYDDIYNKSTRSFSGSYGVINGDGNIQKISTENIVNEDNHTVYNPVTNSTTNYNNWTYDYSDRSYHLTLDDGSNMTVTYGNENVTIVQGDAVYNVYYITETEQGTPAHTHNYIDEITTEPTCVLPGVRTYTCAECGESYTQSVAALGHNWVVKQDIKTQYDNDGNIIQKGYVVYECSRCGEQYKTESSGGLPPSGGGDSGDDSGGGLIIPGDADDKQLATITEKIQSWNNILSTVYTDYIELFKSAFSYLPDELLVLFFWGLASVIFIGIFRRLLGR